MLRLNKLKKMTILIGLLLCMGASTIMQTYFSSALPVISRQFQSVSFYSWVHVSYILASSSIIILSSQLCQRYGNKKNFIAGSLLFGIGTMLAPFSSSMLQLVLARIIMGLGAGIVVPATYGIIGELFQKESYSAVFAAFSVIQIIFHGIGSVAGGYLPTYFSWQMIFYVLLVLEGISFLLVRLNLPSIVTKPVSNPFPMKRNLLFITAMILMTLGMEQGDSISYLFLFCGLFLLFFVIYEDAKHGNELFPIELVKDALLKNLCLQIFLLGAFYHVCLVYLPSLMQFSMNFSPDTAGNFLALFVVLMGVGSILGGIMRMPPRLFILIGWGICLIACLLLKSLFLLAIFLLGFGSGLLMSVLLGYTATRATTHSAGVNSVAHLIRNFGGSMGTILFQFSLYHPINSFRRGIIILSFSAILLAALAFRYQLPRNQQSSCQ